MKRFGKYLAGLVAAAFLLLGSGCSTTDDQVSARPWNSPRGWEHGLPAQMLEGR